MKNKLYVPANISTKAELWNGFTVKSGIISAIITAVSIIVAVIYVQIFQPKDFLGAVFFVMLVCATVISLRTRIENNMSIVDYVRVLLAYGKEQQRFKYIKKE